MFIKKLGVIWKGYFSKRASTEELLVFSSLRGRRKYKEWNNLM